MEEISCITVMDYNNNSLEVIKSYINELFPDVEVKSFLDYKSGFEYIKNNPSCLTIADFSNLSDDDIEIVESIKNHTHKIIITSLDCSTNSIIKALRTGAKEFLPKPVLKDDLQKAINSILKINESEEKFSKVIAIYSNKGGIGKTTIAVNLASELARVTNDKVALVDLNLQLGDVSTFLNISPSFDVGYVVRKLIHNPEMSVENLFEKYKNTSLYVLSDPNYIEQSESITPQLIQKLFYKLKSVFSYIVVDLSSNIDSNTLKILDISDIIMFTAIVNIPSIRNAQRCLNLFRSRNYKKDKVKIIVNRFMGNDEINIDDIESTLDEKVYWKIPNNYFTIMDAINRGVSVWEVNPNSNIGGSFRDLASKVSEEAMEELIQQYR